MKNLFILSLFFCSFGLFAQQSEDSKVYQLPEIEVISKKIIPLVEKISHSPDYNSSLLSKNGFSVIRRGLNFTQDLYSEGFSRGDIKVIVDGEQYHVACPNRMDAPATRINIIDMSSVELTKSASFLRTGFYGKVEYYRTELSQPLNLKAIINKNFGAANDYDLSFSTYGFNSNFSIRYSSGKPYINGLNKTFKDLYGYKDNFAFSFYNMSFRHKIKDLDLEIGSNFSKAKDISFPYLQMDERNSNTISGFVSFKKNKFYINYTDHLMNNNLRNNYPNMQMETAAKNLTFGLTGSFYEVLYRNWNADNFIKVLSSGAYISNKLMPNVDQLSLDISKEFDFNNFLIFVKGGADYFRYKDASRKQFYNELYQIKSNNRIFLSSGILAHYNSKISNELLLTFSTEVATESPEAEQLYVAVRRPGTNPDWSGNPNLEQPVRLGLRSNLIYKFIKIDLFTNFVSNYIEVFKKMKNTKPVMTYDNIDALLSGTNISFNYQWIESNISYLWGENTNNKNPLSEISPLSISTTIRFPEFYGVNIIFNHKYENSQKRINKDLKEFTTSAWNSLGLNLRYSINYFTFDFQINNLLNHNYSRYLSYSRNPFSAGLPIYELGRVWNLTVYYNQQFNF